MSIAKRAAEEGIALQDPPKKSPKVTRTKATKPKAKAEPKPKPEPKPEAKPTPAKADKPKPDPKTRPLTDKALKLLQAVKDNNGPITRKTLLAVTKATSADLSSYMGATQNAKYKHWDSVAMDPKESWSHISLLGREFCTYKEGVQTEDQGKQVTFDITKAGIDYLNSKEK